MWSDLYVRAHGANRYERGDAHGRAAWTPLTGRSSQVAAMSDERTAARVSAADEAREREEQQERACRHKSRMMLIVWQMCTPRHVYVVRSAHE